MIRRAVSSPLRKQRVSCGGSLGLWWLTRERITELYPIVARSGAALTDVKVQQAAGGSSTGEQQRR